MAVTVGKVAVVLRIQVDPKAEVAEPAKTILTDLVSWAEAEIAYRAPEAEGPEVDQATYALVGYLYDAPPSRRGEGYANAWRNSGAEVLLRRHIERRAVLLPSGEGTADDGGGGGGAGIDVDTINALIAAAVLNWAQHGNVDPIPAPKLVNAPGVAEAAAAEAAARMALGDAAQAQTDANTANRAAQSALTDARNAAGAAAGAAAAAAAAQTSVDNLEDKVDAHIADGSIHGGGGGGQPGPFTAVVNTIDPVAIQRQLAGERDGDIVIGYTAAVVAIFRYSSTDTAFREVVRWQRAPATSAGLDAAAVEVLIARDVAAWAIEANADGIPGAKTFDGLFKAGTEAVIPAANVTITFAVGNADDGDEVDETDAAATSFAITDQQAANAGAFIRCRYTLERIDLKGAAPNDIELVLQELPSGKTIGTHNIKDEGSGAAQFPVGDAGQHRWAVRVVTEGAYTGDVRVAEATYLSAQPLADKPIEHIAEAAVSVEAEKRQAQDAAIRAEVKRVAALTAIVDGLPAPTATVKKAVAFNASGNVWEQTDADAFQVPATGFVQFIVGNFGASGIVPVSYCANRQEIMYGVGTDEIGLMFNAGRKAKLYARRGSALSPLASDAYNTTHGLVMLHWDTARGSGGGGGETPAAATASLKAARIAGAGNQANVAIPDGVTVDTLVGASLWGSATLFVCKLAFPDGDKESMTGFWWYAHRNNTAQYTYKLTFNWTTRRVAVTRPPSSQRNAEVANDLVLEYLA